MSSNPKSKKNENFYELPPLPSIRLEKQKLADSVYDVISDYIVSGKLKQGQRLREAKVAQGLDVSRTPVREAFARLENERLLERDPTGAYLVTTWDRSQLLELATVRSTLECLAARIVTEKLELQDYDYLQSLINRMDTAYQRKDFPSLVDLDISFHSYLWEKSGLDLLRDLLESIKIQVLYFMYLTLPGDEEEYAGMHQALLDVFKEREPEKAVLAMRQHIIPTTEEAVKKLNWDNP